jgi:50S ribosomal protein L16 3-hydroxylase
MTAAKFPIEVRASAAQPLGMTPAAFLRDYWQKRPLLIRAAFGADFVSPISANDLGGLACEAFALSRLIVHTPRTDRWRVEHGPFAEDRFSKLPKKHWTLLVQDVDKWDADVAALFGFVDFLPGWRLDDVMISYAVPGGSVGAHVDQYDVFLLQGQGQRRWQIDARRDPPLGFRDDVALKLLKTFSPSHEWLLAPGDVLYLPPGVPHHGIAIDECLTLSLGMRAPSSGELIMDFAEQLAERLGEASRLADPDLSPRRDPLLIERSDLERVRTAMAAFATTDDADLGTWFGGFITRYRNAQTPAAPRRLPTADTIAKRLRAGARLQRHPFARMAALKARGGYDVFLAGDRFHVPARLYALLAAPEALDIAAWEALEEAERDLILRIVQCGHYGVGS